MTSVITVDGKEFDLSNEVGQSVAIVGKRYRPGIKTASYGVVPAWEADVVVLTGEREGHYFDGVLLFQKAIISQLDRAKADSHGEDITVIGPVEIRTTEDGERTYFLVGDGDSTDLRLAAKYGV